MLSTILPLSAKEILSVKDKTIWIINEYAGSRYHGMEFRHYYLGRELVKKGYDVYIITASFSHLFKRLPQVRDSFTFEQIDGINYIWVKVPHYKYAHDKKRVLKWFVFAVKLFRLPVNRTTIPEAIIVSPMAPFAILAAYYFSKKHKAKLIYEVKDIWPLSVVELGGYSKWNPLIMLMQWCENFAYSKADAVISVLPNSLEHMVKHGMPPEKFHYIPNGFSPDDLKESEPLDEGVKSLIPQNKFIVGYTGTIGHANALEYLIEAAKIVEKHQDIHFVIVGEGKEKEKIIKRAKNLGLKNVTFINPIPKSQVQEMLKRVNVCYIGLKDQPLFKFGVSPNKLFDYMCAAKPILYAINSGNRPVDEATCGITVEAGNPQDIADGIMKFYTMPSGQREKMGENGKGYVLKNHSYQTLAEKLIAVFEKD